MIMIINNKWGITKKYMNKILVNWNIERKKFGPSEGIKHLKVEMSNGLKKGEVSNLLLLDGHTGIDGSELFMSPCIAKA